METSLYLFEVYRKVQQYQIQFTNTKNLSLSLSLSLFEISRTLAFDRKHFAGGATTATLRVDSSLHEDLYYSFPSRGNFYFRSPTPYELNIKTRTVGEIVSPTEGLIRRARREGSSKEQPSLAPISFRAGVTPRKRPLLCDAVVHSSAFTVANQSRDVESDRKK